MAIETNLMIESFVNGCENIEGGTRNRIGFIDWRSNRISSKSWAPPFRCSSILPSHNSIQFNKNVLLEHTNFSECINPMMIYKPNRNRLINPISFTDNETEILWQINTRFLWKLFQKKNQCGFVFREMKKIYIEIVMNGEKWGSWNI